MRVGSPLGSNCHKNTCVKLINAEQGNLARVSRVLDLAVCSILSSSFQVIMTITLYDIPSSIPGTWSAHVCKARWEHCFQFRRTWYSLNRDHLRAVFNYKGIPYRTEWVEVPDIEPLSKKLGINPTGQKKDGSPFYTLPAIYDPATGTAIADSFAIAEYLENTYPETPSVFPKESAALQKAFEPTLVQNICPAWPFIIPAVAVKLKDRKSVV